MEYFPCNFGVGDNVLVQIILQGAGVDENEFTDLPPCKIGFSPEDLTKRFDNYPKAFVYFSDARDELLHRRRFLVYDSVFHSHCTFSSASQGVLSHPHVCNNIYARYG